MWAHTPIGHFPSLGFYKQHALFLEDKYSQPVRELFILPHARRAVLL